MVTWSFQPFAVYPKSDEKFKFRRSFGQSLPKITSHMYRVKEPQEGIGIRAGPFYFSGGGGEGGGQFCLVKIFFFAFGLCKNFFSTLRLCTIFFHRFSVFIFVKVSPKMSIL